MLEEIVIKTDYKEYKCNLLQNDISFAFYNQINSDKYSITPYGEFLINRSTIAVYFHYDRISINFPRGYRNASDKMYLKFSNIEGYTSLEESIPLIKMTYPKTDYRLDYEDDTKKYLYHYNLTIDNNTAFKHTVLLEVYCDKKTNEKNIKFQLR